MVANSILTHKKLRANMITNQSTNMDFKWEPLWEQSQILVYPQNNSKYGYEIWSSNGSQYIYKMKKINVANNLEMINN